MDLSPKLTSRAVLFLAIALLIIATPVLGQTGTLIVNQFAVTLSPGIPSTLSVTSTGGTVGFTVDTAADWYSVNPVQGNTPATITITLLSFPPSGTSSAITLTNNSNSANYLIIPIIYAGGPGGSTGSFTVSQTQLFFGYPNGVTQSLVSASSSQAITTFEAQANSQGNWLRVNGTTNASIFNTGTNNLPVSVNASAANALADGTYTGTVTLRNPLNPLLDTAVILVNLTVGSDSGVAGGVAPTSLSFTYQKNSANPGILRQAVTVGGTGAITVGQPSVNWLSVTGTQNAPGYVLVVVNSTANSLQETTHTGTFTITTEGGGSTISVSLRVTSDPVVRAFPGSVNPFFQSGSSIYDTQLEITASDNSHVPISMSSSAGWVTATLLDESTPATLNVSANPAGLPNGINTATITVKGTGTANNTLTTIPVVAHVTGSVSSGTVTVSPMSLSFTAENGAMPGPKQLSIKGPAGQHITAAVSTSTTSGGNNWLSTGISNGSNIITDVDLTVSVNPAGLAAGTYQGKIKITPVGGTAVEVLVNLTVTANVISASTADGTSLTFNHRSGDEAPAGQPITVTGNGSFTATAQSTGNWLSVTPATGTAPTTISAAVNPGNLKPGTYNGTIVVAGTAGATGSTTINVSLTVTDPPPTLSSVTNAASYASGAIAPGELITLFGKDLGPTPAAGLKLDENGNVATKIGDVQVLINGIPAPMIYASALQVSAQVPYEVKGQLNATIQVRYKERASNILTLPVEAMAPGILTADASGSGPAAILYPNPTLASATRGDVIVFYVTGEGETSPAGVNGKVTTISDTGPLTPAPLRPVVVLIDGKPADALFIGEAPSLISGVLQLNVRIPADAPSGDLPLAVTIGGVASQAGVTLRVR